MVPKNLFLVQKITNSRKTLKLLKMPWKLRKPNVKKKSQPFKLQLMKKKNKSKKNRPRMLNSPQKSQP